MKKAFALMLALVIAGAPIAAYAASVSTAPITTSASVDGSLTLTVLLKKNDFAGATITSMNFGQLVTLPLAGGGTTGLRSSPTSTTGTGAVDAFITANSHGLPYTVSQSGTPMSNGAAVLPAGALNVVPVYAPADNGGATMPAGASLGTAGSWVGSKTLYTSEAAGAMRTIQAIYSITDDPAAGATASVPISQPAGTYNGTVTITVTA